MASKRTNTQKKHIMAPRLYKHIDELYNWKHGKQFFSIQKRSILTCFGEKEKDVLLNISTLWPLLSTVSWLRHILIFLARHSKPNFLFFWLFTIIKGYKMDTYIYPSRIPITKKIGMALKVFKIENSRIRGETKKVLQGRVW